MLRAERSTHSRRREAGGAAASVAIVLSLVVAVGVAVALKDKRRSAVEGGGSISTAAVPRLVDLGSSLCIPCKAMAPILEALKKDFAGRLDVVFIDIRDDPDAIAKYDVGLIPTQIFYDAWGKELFRHEGFYGREDILAKWKELGVDLTAPS